MSDCLIICLTRASKPFRHIQILHISRGHGNDGHEAKRSFSRTANDHEQVSAPRGEKESPNTGFHRARLLSQSHLTAASKISQNRSSRGVEQTLIPSKRPQRQQDNIMGPRVQPECIAACRRFGGGDAGGRVEGKNWYLADTLQMSGLLRRSQACLDTAI